MKCLSPDVVYVSLFVNTTPLKYPLITLKASKMKFYNLVDTRSVSLTVICYSDVQKCIKKSDIEPISRPILRPFMSIPGQISIMKILVMKERYGDLKSHFCRHFGNFDFTVKLHVLHDIRV